MKWSARGACTVLSSSLLLACALAEVAVGLRCVSLGSSVRAHFPLGGAAAAGAFYSGLLLGTGQVLLGSALLCCTEKPGCRNLFLLGVLVLLLGVLTAFSGAVVDGDAAALAERKHAHYCPRAALFESPACGRLRDYQRCLVLSAVLSTLECVLGLGSLLAVKRYKAARLGRGRRRSRRMRAGPPVARQERDCCSSSSSSSSSSADQLRQPVSYINLGVLRVFDETGAAEAQRGGHPSIELPGYSPADPELNRCFPFSVPLASELPPAYEDIFPAEECTRT